MGVNRKRLLLIPMVLMTGALAFAFLMPATAATVLRSVAPMAHFGSALSAGSENAPITAAQGRGALGSGNLAAGSSSTGSSLQGFNQGLISTQGSGHGVSTPGEENCGRFGNGHHGGKHDFVCPNRPFPAPAS